MDRAERQQRIIDYLKIKPLSHGQIETCLLKVLNREQVAITSGRKKLLQESLIEQGSNLIPLLVRRMEPDDDDREYEVIYGEDWFITAEELDIERLWVWVFDLSDEQVALARTEMASLAGAEVAIAPLPEKSGNDPVPPVVEVSPQPELTKLYDVIQAIKAQVDQIEKQVQQVSTAKEQPLITIEQVENLLQSSFSNMVGQLTNYIDQKIKSNFDQLTDYIDQRIDTKIGQAGTHIGHSPPTSLEQSLSQVINNLANGNLQCKIDLKTPQVGVTIAKEELTTMYETMNVDGLKKLARKRNLKPSSKSRKDDLVDMNIKWHEENHS